VSGTAITAWRVSPPAGSVSQRGVGRPSASHTRLVMVLSMASALASTPEPV
jgi:hypothetical protein